MDSTKLEEYKNVTFELSTNKTLRYETDCYQDNCKQALWKMKKMVALVDRCGGAIPTSSNPLYGLDLTHFAAKC